MSYRNTFIRVAEDCLVGAAEVPAFRATSTVAELQHKLLSERPYTLTEEELYVRVHGLRKGLSEAEISQRYDELHAEVFAKPQACMRSSPLTKRYGFGAHYDAEGRIGLVPAGTASYGQLAADGALDQVAAMRSSRR